MTAMADWVVKLGDLVLNHVFVVRCGLTKRTDDLLSIGTVNPRVLLFLGIVKRKYIFVKICVW